jgi:amidase
MDTTGGAYAFVGARPKKNGAIVQKLVDAGLIILGKANMTVSLTNTLQKQH